jgi:addiction module RelE/StbE family toxin
VYVILTYTGAVKVAVTKRAEKSLGRVPRIVAVNFLLWRREVEAHGVEAVQKVSGYHDEALRGKLQGVRSVRLGRSYRAFYRIEKGEVRTLIVEEVNKHDYKEIERLLGR